MQKKNLEFKKMKTLIWGILSIPVSVGLYICAMVVTPVLLVILYSIVLVIAIVESVKEIISFLDMR